ncbi:MAG TPA: HD-GYP domain-containing protein [Candidatus Eisenbacteria bacterium]|nr:HD-GYP domain-containing protein [Candidatus Eisenbacteria bacterium]
MSDAVRAGEPARVTNTGGSGPAAAASAANDPGARLAIQGRNLAVRFCVLLKTARVHDVGNVAFQGPLANFIETIVQMWTAEGEFKILSVGDFLYVNQHRLKVDASSYPSYQYLIDEFRARGLGGFAFTGKLAPPEVKKFVRLFLDVDVKAAEPFEEFSRALTKLSVERIVPLRAVVPVVGHVGSEEVRDSRKVAKRTFYRAIESARTVMLSARDRKPIDLRKAKRAVQGIVDLILEEEFSVLGLTALKNHDEYTFQHCVNVSILSIALGQRLGLSKKMLGDLGVAAILHDLGKAAVPSWVLNKAGRLNDEEWKVMNDHPIQGVKMIAKMRGLNELALRAMIVAFQHHLNHDKSGYPRLEGCEDQCLFSRIVAVVDCFDAMTAHRAYRRNAFTPYEALHMMITENVDKFDPIVLKAFINTVGMYPAGTVVLLDTNEIAVVTEPSPHDIFRPKAKVVRDRDRREVDGALLDLHARDEASGAYAASIVSALNPEEYGINIADALT